MGTVNDHNNWCSTILAQILIPLPETVMSRQPVLLLDDLQSESGQARPPPIQKKDRTKLRHQQQI